MSQYLKGHFTVASEILKQIIGFMATTFLAPVLCLPRRAALVVILAELLHNMGACTKAISCWLLKNFDSFAIITIDTCFQFLENPQKDDNAVC